MRELSPLLVMSPSIRPGTTLLQRLLCPAGNALAYGHARQCFTSDLPRVV